MKNISTTLLIMFTLGLMVNISVTAQNSDSAITILKNTGYSDTVQSYLPPVFIPVNCSVSQPVSIGGGKYAFTVTPNVNFTGTASVLCQYYDFKPPFSIQPRFRNYVFNVVSSLVKAKADFVTFEGDDVLAILPLSNDYSSTGISMLNGLAQVQSGTAAISGDTIFYYPQADINEDYIIYVANDTLGASDAGIVYINRLSEVTPDSLHISFTITNVQSRLLFLPQEGYTPSSGYSTGRGSLMIKAGSVFEYTPNKGVSGLDNFSFSDENGHIVTVTARILNKFQNTSSVVDDVVFTPVNTAVTFNVLANDLSSNFPISSYSPSLTLVSTGVFSYTPPTGFSGLKTFSYTVNYGTYQSTGKIFINVGNFAPQQGLTYQFSTPKNNALVLDYQMPIAGYAFEILTDPQFGSLEIFDQNTAVSLDCNELTGKAIIVYHPYNNYTGIDEFDIKYCINGEQCQHYKVTVNILNVEVDACLCLGRDCVWPGDANGDGRVSISDLLPIGRFMGRTGLTREDDTLNFWTGTHASDWNEKQTNGKNIKHADSNGDGMISTEDVEALNDYFNKIHNLVPKQDLGIKDYPFTMIPNTTELDSGDLLVLDIVIGSNNTPVADIHGLAFAFNIDPSIIDSASFSGYFYENSWFSSGNPSLQLIKQPVSGNIQAAFTRTGGTPGSGNGIIGQFSIVVDEADGIKTDEEFVLFRVSAEDIEMEDSEGERFMLENFYQDLKIRVKKSVPVPSESKLIVYPNPAGSQMNIHFNGRNVIKQIKLSDMFGKMISLNMAVDDNRATINTAGLPSGFYVLQVGTTDGVISKKIQVIND
jgi:hypothetical protein